MIETLKAKEPTLASIEDIGKQIAIESKPVDARIITEQVANLQSRAKSLKTDSEKKLTLLQKVISERSAFETDLTKCIAWLKAKDAALESHDQMSIEADSVRRDLDKLKDVKEELRVQVS